MDTTVSNLGWPTSWMANLLEALMCPGNDDAANLEIKSYFFKDLALAWLTETSNI